MSWWCLSSTSFSTSGCPSKSARPEESTIASQFLVSSPPRSDYMLIRFALRYKVFYPTLYATESENKDAKLFNCVQVYCFFPCFDSFPRSVMFLYLIHLLFGGLWQRGHQNSLESMPVFFVTLLLGGLQYPVAATGLGGFYTLARFFYFKGYSSGVPENRLKIG